MCVRGQRSYICVLGASILPLYTILIFDFGIVGQCGIFFLHFFLLMKHHLFLFTGIQVTICGRGMLSSVCGRYVYFKLFNSHINLESVYMHPQLIGTDW